jgi:hypothetical protein
MLSDVTPDDASACSHGTGCGCGEPHGERRTIAREPPRGLSAISTLAPVIACAFCIRVRCQRRVGRRQHAEGAAGEVSCPGVFGYQPGQDGLRGWAES